MKNERSLELEKGFTVVEVLVSASIIALIASLILANYPRFNEALAVRQVAEQIASATRLVQAYGLSVKEFGTGSDIFPGYGIYFQSASPASYIIFADVDADFQYDGVSERVKEIAVETSSRIYDLCGNVKNNPPGDCGLLDLSAIYLRPYPSVSLKSGASSYSDIEIIVRSPKGMTKTIILWQGGQVSIE